VAHRSKDLRRKRHGHAAGRPGRAGTRLLVTATSAAARRTGLLPQWLAWLGFVVAASMITSFTFIPFLAFLAWLLLVGLILAARRPVAAHPGAA
jgi:hypothetical protein